MNYLENERYSDCFSEDLKAALREKFGLSHLNTYYSLSNSQGDGLCLHGYISCSEIFDNDKFKRIALKNISSEQVISISGLLYKIDFKHCGRYYHSKSISINSDIDNTTQKQEDIIDMIVENVKAWYFSFCDEWETYGYRYFYEISDDDMIEGCENGDYWFTETGQIINTDKYRETV
jgi:hypothetical protein